MFAVLRQEGVRCWLWPMLVNAEAAKKSRVKAVGRRKRRGQREHVFVETVRISTDNVDMESI